MNRTLVICKPDAVERGLVGEIVARLERKGLRIVALELRAIDVHTAARHYAEHESKPFYASLIDAARSAGARVFVDSSGEGLRASAKASPEFLKVNRAEAEGLLGRPIKDAHEAVHGAMEIIENGAGSAAITLGADGLVWVESKHGPVWSARPPQLKVISAVGSGDSTLGGFACAAARGLIGEDALRLAVACGAANCLADAPARIDRSTVESLIPKIEVQRHAF